MKLRALYSNDPARFPRINFRDGLNVVFARVRDFSLKSRDSHNLGKTFLINVLDFPLLATIDKNHPYRIHGELFGDFVFFLELETGAGQLVTVRRAVSGRKAISINISPEGGQDYRDLPEEGWQHSRLGIQQAKEILNELLNLSSIAPFDFRKGLGYYLRRQADYNDEFMISRFGRGADRDWKPFMALLLGFNNELVGRKYELDRREDVIKTMLREVEPRGERQLDEYDELRGVVEVKSEEVGNLRRRVNAFDFAEVESEITTDTVREVESSIADLNERRYELEQERSEIERALQTRLGFDVEAIRSIFEEAGVSLPGALVHDYGELVEFNKRISSDRKQRLRVRLHNLTEEQRRIQKNLIQLNDKRVAALEVVTQRETLRKFQALQERLLKEEENLVHLRQQLAQLDQVTGLRQRRRRIEEERLRLVDEVEAMVRSGSDHYTSFRGHFAEFARSILFAPAILATSVNPKGNLEFRTRVLEGRTSRRETAEGEGASYKKVLCACFDLAALASWANGNFYRFAYHDGIFEGLDNRRKVSLLAMVRRACEEFGIQYILTVIDSDLPRDEEDNKLLFQQEEIIRELHDGGDDGRLFRMSSF
ncbi:MAG: DUF2326 domain-containing protein [bacterium]|nr:DUF2326 domain-containing protein [bacterium]